MPEYGNGSRPVMHNNYKNDLETQGMTPLNEYALRQIAETLARAERRTGAELLSLLIACVLHALPAAQSAGAPRLGHAHRPALRLAAAAT